jgi:hypothetical protein
MPVRIRTIGYARPLSSPSLVLYARCGFHVGATFPNLQGKRLEV